VKDGSLSQHSYPTLPQRRTGGRKLPPTPRKPSTLNLGVVGTVVLAAQRGNREHTARHRTGIDLFCSVVFCLFVFLFVCLFALFLFDHFPAPFEIFFRLTFIDWAFGLPGRVSVFHFQLLNIYVS